MNPYRIYREEWAHALVTQAESECYRTFVAMPFHEHFSYRARDILSGVIEAAVSRANESNGGARRFAKPERVDGPKGASVITEEIAIGILTSHFFLADLTFQNPGVLLETGVAFAVKPGRQIILITQGKPTDLHFDLQGNNVIGYSPSGAVEDIAAAFIAAGLHFEAQLNHYVRDVRRHLSPDAIAMLLRYRKLQQIHPGLSLHADDAAKYFGSPDSRFGSPDSRLRFELAARELRDRDLRWTDILPSADGFLHGMHATELGKLVTAQISRELFRQSSSDEPADAGVPADEGSGNNREGDA